MKQILIIIMVVVGIIIASPFIQKEIILANSEKHADSLIAHCDSLIAHCDSLITDTYSIIGYTPTKDLSTSEVESLFSGTK